MGARDNILISVDERYARRMLNGAKMIELRRRPIRIAPGGRVWIYSKIPRGQVDAFGIVDDVISDSPHKIWEQHWQQCGVTKSEFESYFHNSEIGYAIKFKEIIGINTALSLEILRQSVATFQPPQFFKRLTADSPELNLFLSAIA